MLKKRKIVKNGLKLTRVEKLQSYPSNCPANCQLCIGCKYLINYHCTCDKIARKFCEDVSPLYSQSNYRYIYAEET